MCFPRTSYFLRIILTNYFLKLSTDSHLPSVEKIGTYSIGVLIAILALAAEGSAIAALITHSEPDSSNASIIISASALACMIALWLPKRWLAKALDSSTVRLFLFIHQPTLLLHVYL